MAVGQAFCLQQEPQAVDGMLKIRLRRRFGALLEFKQIILYLFGIQLGGQGFETQRQGCHMTGIIIEGFTAAPQDGNIPLEALQQFSKTVNFARGTV